MSVAAMGSGSASASEDETSTRFLRNLDDIEVFGKFLTIAIVAVIVLFGFCVGISADSGAGDAARGFRAFCVALAVVIAAGSIGGLLGFLFGIPKLFQAPAVTASGNPPGKPGNEVRGAAQSRRFLTTNTSLEEISDWLTKIIIGLGLVQFQLVLAYLHKASVYAASYIQQAPVGYNNGVIADGTGSLATAMIYGLIVASTVISCLFVYVETRTRLTLLFTGIEVYGDAQGREEIREALDQPVSSTAPVEVGSGGGAGLASMEPPQSVPKPSTDNDVSVASIPRENLKTPAEIVGWASAQARLGNLQVSEDAIRDAVQRDPNNVEFLLRLADVRRLRNNFAGYVDLVLEAIRKPPRREAVVEAGMQAQLVALYLPHPDGFDKSLALAEELEHTDRKNDPMLFVRKAAALGQRYSFQKRADANPASLTRTYEKAKAAIRKVIELAPDPASMPRTYLRQMFDPKREGSKLSENDLEVFRLEEDPSTGEFHKLIYGAGPAASP